MGTEISNFQYICTKSHHICGFIKTKVKINFTVLPCIFILSLPLFIQLNAQLDCSRKMLKLTLKFILKFSYMFRFNKSSSGSLLLCFVKDIIIKIVSQKSRYESFRWCSCIFIQSLLVCVQCTVQSETVCTVHSAE